MSTADKAKAVFIAAMDLPPQEQLRILDTECGGDATLRRRVEAMLHAHRQSDPLLDHQAAEHVVIEPPLSFESPGTIIAGRYRLVELIGEGGMGTVWKAEQTEPVQRTVAVKLVKAGMDTKEVLARFGAERQALAVMDHPNIAKVLDGGSTEHGRPFFVMELVRGKPITQFCRDEQVGIAARLDLFVQVCQAVQHAHQKGVIHRDLKPSNILVNSTGDQPVPKVIDFGLAKATLEPLTANSLHSAPGRVLGTIQYMSPEQAHLENVDIDTRTDVYALGVVLYELLTGTTPIDSQRLKKAALLEMLRMIQVEEPARPSARIGLSSASGIVPPGGDFARLSRTIRGDLDWIVMKALEKERSRRYESAASFAADVNRYLQGEAVAAHPPSKRYRLRKFVRRNRVQVLAAAVTFAALVAGVIGTSISLVAAKRQEKTARDERDAKEFARQQEETQRGLAEARAKKMEKGVEILGDVFADLNAKADRPGEDPLAVTLGNRLERAAHELRGEAVGDPLMVARLQKILGLSLATLGHYDRAIELMESAIATRNQHFDADDLVTLPWRADLAGTYPYVRKFEKAIEQFETLATVYERIFGPDDLQTLWLHARLGSVLGEAGRPADATRILEKVVSRAKAGGHAEEGRMLVAANMLAQSHTANGAPKTALKMLEALLPVCQRVLGKDHPDSLLVELGLAVACRLSGDHHRSLETLQRIYDRLALKYGETHKFTLAARYNMASAAREARDFPVAIVGFQRLAEIKATANGPEDESVASLNTEFGECLIADQQYELAVEPLEKAFRVYSKLAAESPEIARARNALVTAYMSVQQFDKAIPLFEHLLAEAKRHKEKPEAIIGIVHSLADAYFRSGQFGRSVQIDEQNVTDAERDLGVESIEAMMCRNHLGESLRGLGQLDKAVAIFERNIPIVERKVGEKHMKAIECRLNLLVAQWQAGKLPDARAKFEALANHAKQSIGPGHPTTSDCVHAWADVAHAEKDWSMAVAIRNLVLRIQLDQRHPLVLIARTQHGIGESLLAAGKFAEAERPLRESVTIREKLEPNSWQTFAVKSALGFALGQFKKFAEAERQLIGGYEGLKARAERIPAAQRHALTLAVERLLAFSELAGQKSEAEQWRQELDRLKAKK
jgi:eukaryotic-like serine/threonine-protein kinase